MIGSVWISKPLTMSSLALVLATVALHSAEPVTLDLWPMGEMPGPAADAEGEERDLTKPSDKRVAGEPIIKLGHVSRPQVEVHLPPVGIRSGSAVVVCPGGGFHILAWDIEGTEVAKWLNGLGIAAVVPKYRVPTRPHGDEVISSPGAESVLLPRMAVGPMMDAQRAVSIARAHADDWGIASDRVGILGFSAGGFTAAMTTLVDGRTYPAVDETDALSCKPNFALIIYPGGLVDEQRRKLKPFVPVTKSAAPMFFVHAADDHASCLNSTALFGALNQAGVSAELHVYESGGHGYGLRPTQEPVTRWTDRAEEWLARRGALGRRE